MFTIRSHHRTVAYLPWNASLCFGKIRLRAHATYIHTIHINTEEDDKATEFEKVHSKFCKYVLGISKHSSTTLTYSELGRFPLVNRIAAQCIAYWKRMVNG